MAGRRKEIQIQVEITSNEQWEEALAAPGLLVVDVYQKWCGPCKAVQSLFRRLRTEFGEDLLRFAVAEANTILDLSALKGKCQPVFLFYFEGKLVSVIKGVKGPLLQRTILELVEEEKKKQELGSKYISKLQEIFLEERPKESKPEPSNENDKETDDHGPYHVVIIKPDVVAAGHVEPIKQKVEDAGYSIIAEEERVLNQEQILDFYRAKAEDSDFMQLMSSGPVHALILRKENGQSDSDGLDLSEIIDPIQAELVKTEKSSEDISEMSLGFSDDSRELASRQLAFFFPSFNFSADTSAPQADTNPRVQRTVALIRPGLLRERKDEILQTIRDSGFQIAMQREMTLTEEQARMFYREHEGKDYFPCLIHHMTSGPLLALALTREDAIQHWRGLLGPKILEEAKQKSPESLRSQFAMDDVPINQLHGSSTPEEAERDLSCFFPVEHTLAVIKPGVSQEQQNNIVSQIKEAGFSISQVKETQLTRDMAQMFYKEHKGKEFYDSLLDYMSRAPSVLMILSKENAVNEWRELMGPSDPEQARQCSPGSLRAQFAQSILENVVHGSSNIQHATDNIKFIFGDGDM
ncbi:thioredoxin domain-containing protein 3 homolog [Chanos chanos]|uniref:Thioredoxin domain-containing protein 3 homolog n=1 Tax=Chanos chanos TaxID=29144 RepID=A0A6J2VSV1_CHACN|nr:thioredoxin domain-containing protein 3 homolog [Chanos chanos]